MPEADNGGNCFKEVEYEECPTCKGRGWVKLAPENFWEKIFPKKGRCPTCHRERAVVKNK